LKTIKDSPQFSLTIRHLIPSMIAPEAIHDLGTGAGSRSTTTTTHNNGAQTAFGHERIHGEAAPTRIGSLFRAKGAVFCRPLQRRVHNGAATAADYIGSAFHIQFLIIFTGGASRATPLITSN
jgi:hypothetical protein